MPSSARPATPRAVGSSVTAKPLTVRAAVPPPVRAPVLAPPSLGPLENPLSGHVDAVHTQFPIPLAMAPQSAPTVIPVCMRLPSKDFQLAARVGSGVEFLISKVSSREPLPSV